MLNFHPDSETRPSSRCPIRRWIREIDSLKKKLYTSDRAVSVCCVVSSFWNRLIEGDRIVLKRVSGRAVS